jgi:hypothetical protein
VTIHGRRLVVVGETGWTTLGSSFARAAADLGLGSEFCDVAQARSRWRILNALAWRLGPRLPPFPGRVARSLRQATAAHGRLLLLTTGRAPVRAADLRRVRDTGGASLHFSSDDPWNPRFAARWHGRALVEYDVVFTPRRSNVEQLKELGCREVRYLPFAHDPAVFPDGAEAVEDAPDNGRALFVGGADADRAAFIRKFREAGGKVALVGDYWRNHSDLSADWLGHLPPDHVARLTRAAGVNLILVRRANRDGHTMRSFEAAAIGGCLAVEDTAEHREIFGPDGAAVRYFDGPRSAAALHAELMQDPAERRRLASSACRLIRLGRNTYADRLETMVAAIEEGWQMQLSQGEA